VSYVVSTAVQGLASKLFFIGQTLQHIHNTYERDVKLKEAKFLFELNYKQTAYDYAEKLNGRF